MAHIDTVILGLTSCLAHNCAACPYDRNGKCEGTELLRDAVENLHLRQSFVLTPEELLLSDFVYLEHSPDVIIEHHVEPCAVIGLDHNNQSMILSLKDGGHFTYDFAFDLKAYNIKWRCWRTMPTPWQMRNTEWIRTED